MRDTGIGIPADRAHRLFEEFSQLDSSTTRKYGGTGLGLAVSKRLAELMGGRMWVESESGRGRHLPLHDRRRAGRRALTAGRRRHPAELDGQARLVVDDNAINRRILDLQTEAWGLAFPVVRVRRRGARQRSSAGDAFDLAILDMHMPEMDGLELATGSATARPDLPLVLYTSLGGSRRAIRCSPACLAKPVKQSQLFDMLVVGPRRDVASGDAESAASTDGEASAETLGERHPLRILLAEDNTVNQQIATARPRVARLPGRRRFERRSRRSRRSSGFPTTSC